LPENLYRKNGENNLKETEGLCCHTSLAANEQGFMQVGY
jgi:hypothetical protein